MSSGDIWQFSAQVTDDNRTPNPTVFDSGQALDGCGVNGGEVLIIFEGTDFEDRTHRQWRPPAPVQAPSTMTSHWTLSC